METDRHITLKRLAIAYLIHTGFTAAATEVHAPSSRFRVDAAGYIDTAPQPAAPTHHNPTPPHRAPLFIETRRPAPRTPAPPRTVIIECKQQRADFLRDHRELPTLLAERHRLERRRQRIEDVLKEQRPELQRSGAFLFNELEAWDFDTVSHGGYRQTLRDLRKAHQRIHKQTKFYLAAQHHLADRLFILAPSQLIHRTELPHAWGLLEASHAALRGRPPSIPNLIDRLEAGEPLIRVTRTATDRHPTPERRARMLRNIAARATRDAALTTNHSKRPHPTPSPHRAPSDSASNAPPRHP